MTNEKIIMNARLALLDAGLIGTTGRQYEIIDENGDSRFVDEPEELHTFEIWQRMGYSVKKGEKAIAKIRIWKYSEKTEELTGKTQQDEKADESEERSRMFMKLAYFFAPSQVEKADVEDLVAKAVKAAKRCRAGKITSGEYFQRLKSFAKRSGDPKAFLARIQEETKALA